MLGLRLIHPRKRGSWRSPNVIHDNVHITARALKGNIRQSADSTCSNTNFNHMRLYLHFAERYIYIYTSFYPKYRILFWYPFWPNLRPINTIRYVNNNLWLTRRIACLQLTFGKRIRLKTCLSWKYTTDRNWHSKRCHSSIASNFNYFSSFDMFVVYSIITKIHRNMFSAHSIWLFDFLDYIGGQTLALRRLNSCYWKCIHVYKWWNDMYKNCTLSPQFI